MSVQLEITTENLLNAVVQMPESEFDSFVEKARKLRQKEQKISPREADLLHKINNLFPNDERRRYSELYRKYKYAELEENEITELEELVCKFENLNAQRIKYIGELANLRGETLEQVMKIFQISNSDKEL